MYFCSSNLITYLSFIHTKIISFSHNLASFLSHILLKILFLCMIKMSFYPSISALRLQMAYNNQHSDKNQANISLRAILLHHTYWVTSRYAADPWYKDYKHYMANKAVLSIKWTAQQWWWNSTSEKFIWRSCGVALGDSLIHVHYIKLFMTADIEQISCK